MKDMQGRRAAVTGSATGLGRAIALKLAERGADVIVNCARSLDEAERTADEIRALGVEARVVQADVAREEGCAALARAAADWGALDMLVNNAGITRHAPDHGDMDALSAQDFLDVYAVNVVGAFMATRAMRPLLEAAAAASGRASAVLNTSSIAGVTGIGSSVAYAASKGALNTMTLSLARALAPSIRVNAICPGFIGTRWFRKLMDDDAYARQVEQVKARTPLRAASEAEDIADAALFLLSDAARHVTGELLSVDAGLHLGFAPLKAR
ncbi:SDR family NAD(P)-dependent oxidoreductase [Oceanicella actignis]|uniref:SDR family NAD(P)-dependent oxidoreductase n=1 Tax=Oceanicella actignis TaxID=1189325 RepID=UPI0011E8907C|nr:SDR family NAD(P)-dependent oxidoreductase [Oceanicella actignis]TYO88580.1 3-oxoacyl-[acyl-carrier protein] reductase [Oceanicella actignis]